MEKLSSPHPTIWNLVPVHERAVKLCTDHFIKTGPFICCQGATEKKFLLVYGDPRIMLGWIIERQILAKVLSAIPSHAQVKQQRKALTYYAIQLQLITAAVITGACLLLLRCVDKSLGLNGYLSCTEAEASSQ